MTPEQQVVFVDELLGAFRKKFLEHHSDGVIPEEWDGMELRELIFDMARESRAMTRVGLTGRSSTPRCPPAPWSVCAVWAVSHRCPAPARVAQARSSASPPSPAARPA